jgi:hypothetical protein
MTIAMTAHPNLLYKNFLDISRSALGLANAEIVDSVFNPNFPEMRRS